MIDVRETWDFSNPGATRTAFEELLPSLDDPHDRFDVIAQIARTYSLSGENEKCHEVLKPDWDEALKLGGRAAASFMIEAARAHRGLGNIDQARKGFLNVAESGPDDLQVDAMHMLALISSGEEVEEWNQRAIQLAKSSKEEWAQRWIGSLYNNVGWSRFESGDIEDALEYFESALMARYEFGQNERVNEAKWCIGHTLVALNRMKEATELHLDMGGTSEDEAEVRKAFSAG